MLQNMKNFMKKMKEQKGLTLVELLAVIVILGIIAGIAVPSIGNIIDNSKKDAHIANAIMLANSAKLANVEGLAQGTAGTYTMAELTAGGFLESTPKNPGNAGDYDPEDSKVLITDSAGVLTYTITLVSNDTTPVTYLTGNLGQLNADTARSRVNLE
jgi:type IV pilus assembly protein PilA